MTIEKEESLNYILDFAINTDWNDLKRRERLRALFNSWCFVFGVTAGSKEFDTALDLIHWEMSFSRTEGFKDYMTELIM